MTAIVNTMATNALERVREIGTMLALGLRPRQIVGLFMREAVILSAVGTLIGCGFGWSIVKALGKQGLPMKLAGSTYTPILRPSLSISVMVVTFAAITVGAIISAAYPAFRAARMTPADALRQV